MENNSTPGRFQNGDTSVIMKSGDARIISAHKVNTGGSSDARVISANKLKNGGTAQNRAPPTFAIHQAGGHTGTNGCEGIDGDRNGTQDPFVNGVALIKSSKVQKLSPEAVPFVPRQWTTPNGDMIIQTPNNRIFETPGGSSLASGRTLGQFETPRTIQVTEGVFDYCYPTGEFADNRFTRYLKISGVPASLGSNAIRMLIKGKTHRVPDAILEHQRSQGILLLAFSNIVDSVNAAGEIPSNYAKWEIDFLNASDFAELVVPGSGKSVSAHKGQLTIVAYRNGPRVEWSAVEILSCIRALIKNYGMILAWNEIKTEYPYVKIRMEYYNLNDAERAKVALNGSVFGALELSVEDYTSDVVKPERSIAKRGPLIVRSQKEDLCSGFEGLNFDKNDTGNTIKTFGYSRAPGSEDSDCTVTPMSYGLSSARMIGPSPYGYIAPPIGPILTTSNTIVPGGPVTVNSIVPYGYPPMVEVPISTYCGEIRGRRAARMTVLGGGNNVVNLQRIAHGQDVRTTIMLRNIPNKMPQAELKALIDETNHGEYDFMYLRIDFANNCNVGYAFINFVDPLAIVKFVRIRAGSKWARYNSDKVAEISYATIQGKDCLIQKFRNSSVMLEDPSFRPKLFHTGNGSMAGKEEIFPPPDNDSKLRRSIENAGAVGLFAPRAGQYFRESQRRRRSKFDRGTNLAQMEEASYVPDIGYSAFLASAPQQTIMGPQSSMAIRSAPLQRLDF